MDNLVEEMYQEIILEEASEKFGSQNLSDAQNISHQYNPTCGDDIKVSVSLNNAKQEIETIKWHGNGCSISIASASIMTKLLSKKEVLYVNEMIQNFKDLMNSRGLILEKDGSGVSDQILDQLGDASVFLGTAKFPARIKCALLAWVALENSLQLSLNA